MPRLEDLIKGRRTSRPLTSAKGYWQVPVAEGAKTVHRLPYPSKKPVPITTMPFGLQGALATFQRLMDHVLEGMGARAEVFRCIRDAGLTIHPKKCSLVQQEVRYLGHIIGNGVIKPQKNKVEAVQDVRSFLGLAGWYQRFIPNFATPAAPLTDVTRKPGSSKVEWGEVQEQTFQDLKGTLLCEPVRQSPDFEQMFTVQTDASRVGLGAVFLQGEAPPRNEALGSGRLSALP